MQAVSSNYFFGGNKPSSSSSARRGALADPAQLVTVQIPIVYEKELGINASYQSYYLY